MLKIFIGYDHRQPVSYNVLQQSILSLSSKPVAITPLVINQLPLKRQGLTPFTFSRFLVPYLCNYEGFALFLDADMLLTTDIAELFDYVEKCEEKEEEKAKFINPDPEYKEPKRRQIKGDEVLTPELVYGYDPDKKYGYIDYSECKSKAVYVVKNEKKFEWASAIMYNCSHPSNKIMTPEYIETAENLHGISWLKDEEIGDLPPEWNRLVGYDEVLDDAKLLHYTQGVPVFPETQNSPKAQEWMDVAQYMTSAIEWKDLMGGSVHAVNCDGKFLPKFLFDLEKKQPKPEYKEIIKELLK